MRKDRRQKGFNLDYNGQSEIKQYPRISFLRTRISTSPRHPRSQTIEMYHYRSHSSSLSYLLHYNGLLHNQVDRGHCHIRNYACTGRGLFLIVLASREEEEVQEGIEFGLQNRE